MPFLNTVATESFKIVILIVKQPLINIFVPDLGIQNAFLSNLAELLAIFLILTALLLAEKTKDQSAIITTEQFYF